MGIYKSNTSPEQDAQFEKRETVDEFLARGGNVTKVDKKASGKKKIKTKTKTVKVKNNKIDAQALLDSAMGTPQEAEVVAFLKTQGIEVN